MPEIRKGFSIFFLQAFTTKFFHRLAAFAAALFLLCPEAEAVVVRPDIPVTENLIQTGNAADELVIDNLDVFEEGVFADFGGGTDTVILTTNGSYNASRIRPGGRFRNFERVMLSVGDDAWTISVQDLALERIDAFSGTDGLILGDGDHDASDIGANRQYRNFEFANLSAGNNVWTATDADTSLQWIDALGGADTVALGNVSGNAADIGANRRYRGFERATLSDGDDEWEFTDGDAGLREIDALAGTDLLVFGDGNHNSEGYTNFERALLSDNDNTWTVTDGDADFEYIDALDGGGDTLAFENAAARSAREIGGARLYRNFERASLSDGDDSWSVTENDDELTAIDAGGGTADTLEGMIADAGDDGVFNASDSNFSAGDITAKYQNFEQVAVGTSDGSDTWTAGAADTTKTWEWISGRDGFDTLNLGDGDHDASDIGANRFYRNFERALLSAGGNIWTVTDGDADLERIEALAGTDTVVFGDGNHTMTRKYRGFEFANLSAGDNVWTATEVDKGLVAINALGGTDTLVLGDGGHNAADIGANRLYRNFENAELSAGSNTWTITGGDTGLTAIDALAGTDTLVLGDGGHSAAGAGIGGKYRNFESAELSAGNNSWSVGAGDDELEIIDALGGTDTLALGGGSHNAADIGAERKYRNFESANLSASADIWTITDDDAALQSIDAGGGSDTLEDGLADIGRDGIFNASDSDFSSGDPGTGDYRKYLNFERVAVGTSDGSDTWTVNSADDTAKGWRWINARGGTDTLAFGDGNHSAANAGAARFYRNFERAELSDGDGAWSAGAEDDELEIIDALGGTDTLSLGDGGHNAANIGAEGKYRNFERAELSDGDNSWEFTDGDAGLAEIDALGGTDTLTFGTGHHNSGRYRNFEFANLSAGDDIWSVTAGDAQFDSVNAGGGTDTLEDLLSDSERDGIFNASDSSFSPGDIGSGDYANYARFNQVAVGTGSGNEVWTVNPPVDTAKNWQWVSGRDGVDTLAFGDGDHSAANVGAGEFYRNFERATLSDGDNIWSVTGGEGGLETIDALGGTDTLAFGAGNHDGSALARYSNFERATLSDGNDRWAAGANDSDLMLIDAMGGDDVLAFGTGHHNSVGYANFERAALSDGDDAWSVTEGDDAFVRIEALGGTDTLEDFIADGGDDGIFNASDSDFSANQVFSGNYAKYRNFERVAIGTTNGADSWTANAADDTGKGWQWVNAREGKDTLLLGSGNHSSLAIGANRFYRNFERAELSAGNNTWFAGAGDAGLEEIDALDGTDLLSFGAGSHSAAEIGMSRKYQNFERAELSAGNNVWSVTAGEGSSGLEWIDALGGTDTIVFGNGSHDAQDIGNNLFYRNFERAELSAGNNSWTVGGEDDGLVSIDALGGADTLEFGDGNHEMTAKYAGFEFANLSAGENIWTVTGLDGRLEYVNAMAGTDTLAFGNGDHSAANVGADGKYRQFERAELSAGNNVWTVTGRDTGLAEIDALGGTDTLEDLIADAGGDGIFNASDSVFSSSDPGTGAYARYLNFDQVAVGTGSGNEVWTVDRSADAAKDWQWVSGRNGVDTLAFGDGDHSAADVGAGEFYRNFERATLSGGDNIWSVTVGEGGLETIDALGGTDTLAFGAGNHDGSALARYSNFERATLSGGDDSWAAGANDSDLTYIDALGGEDALILGSGDHDAANIGTGKRYRNFQRAELSAGDNVWSATAGEGGLMWIDALNGADTIVFENGNHDARNIGNDRLYRNFERVRLSGAENGDWWTVTARDSGIEHVDAMGGNRDTIVLGGNTDNYGQVHIRGKYAHFERVRLSDTANVWTVRGTDENLEYIDALGGTDTLEFTQGRGTASDTGDNARYRGFENARLSGFDDSWERTDGDIDLTEIDALGGTDFLEDQLPDTGDGIFNASDSDFSESDLGGGDYAKYQNFERVAVGTTNGDDLWTASNDDFGKDWAWINAREGYDTLSLGDGNHDASNIGARRFYRNFERAGLSTESNTWTITENDSGIDEIDALGGFDTLEFGNGSHDGSVLERYRNFERARLSAIEDVWTVSAADSGLSYIDALAGTDVLRFEQLNPAGRVLGGNHSAVNIGAEARYRNFERVQLGGGQDSWTITERDSNVDFVDARGGPDTLIFGDGNHSAANVGANMFYRNFEVAALSVGNNEWTANAADERGLVAIDALDAGDGSDSDTLLLGDGNHSAANIGANALYRNFERVEMSAGNNAWFVSGGDTELLSINALGGVDTLEDLLADAGGDGIFNASDSSFSPGDIGSGDYANYANFEQVAVGTGNGDDTWTVNSAADMNAMNGWRWINARGGTDTLSFGNGNHSAANVGAERFYRNFERASLSDTDNRWEVAGGEDGLIEINGRAGEDAIVFGDGDHGGNALARYTNFENALLSGGVNTWEVAGDEGDHVDYVDGLGGTDTMLFDVGANSFMSFNGENVGDTELYRNFESLRKTGEGTLFVQRPLNLESGGDVRIDEGAVAFSINIETAGGMETGANSGAITADAIHAGPNAAIAVGDFDVVRFSHINDSAITLFTGDTANTESANFSDPGLFTDIVVRPDNILLALDSEEGAREEIEERFENDNSRELLVAVHRALRNRRVETGSDVGGVVSQLDGRTVLEGAVRSLVPSEHAGVNYEIIDLQRVLFDSIEEKAVEAVRLMPWDERSENDTHRVFASGFEKTSSGGLYKTGSRGYSAGVYRALFDSKMGVGISGAATFLETRRERVTEKTSGFHGALYSNYESGGLSLRAVLAAGTHEYDSERSSALLSLGETITGKTDILVYGGRVSAGLEILRNLPVRIKPDISFTLSQVSADGYSENGGMNISFGRSTMTSAEAGARINAAFNPLKAGLRTIVQPEIEAGVYYDFAAADEENVAASMLGADYTVLRPQTADDIRYFVGGKLILSDHRNLAFRVGYRVDFWNGMRSYIGSGQFHIRF